VASKGVKEEVVRRKKPRNMQVRFQVLTAARMKAYVFWDVAPCSLKRTVPVKKGKSWLLSEVAHRHFHMFNMVLWHGRK
jgi:hypothetical protein